MKRTAVLLDLGFVLHKLYRMLGKRSPTANEVRDFALKCLGSNEELFRIYCYHCPPYEGVQTHPLSKTKEDFSQTEVYLGMSNLIRDLKVTDNIAFRSGELSFERLAYQEESCSGHHQNRQSSGRQRFCS